MMDEEREERAALYALGLLDLDEAAAFEREMATDRELRVLADELREAAASLARTDANVAPPTGLKTRLLAQVAAETHARHPEPGKIIAGPWRRMPWAVAAALAVCCGALTWKVSQLKSARQKTRDAQATEAVQRVLASSNARSEAMRQIAFCSLEPVPAAQQTGPQATVLWDAAQRRGRLRITKLPLAAEGKDYQLWTVEEGRKDPVSAGIVKVGADGSAEIDFQPQGDDGKTPAVAFALSLERAGGAPQNEGPILYLGKL